MDLGGKFIGCLHFASQGYEGVLPGRQVGEQAVTVQPEGALRWQPVG